MFKVLVMFHNSIGMLQPIPINLKILFLQICKNKVNWDDEISVDLKNDWKKKLDAVETMVKIYVPRKIINQNSDDPSEQIELLTRL